MDQIVLEKRLLHQLEVDLGTVCGHPGRRLLRSQRMRIVRVDERGFFDQVEAVFVESRLFVFFISSVRNGCWCGRKLPYRG